MDITVSAQSQISFGGIIKMYSEVERTFRNKASLVACVPCPQFYVMHPVKLVTFSIGISGNQVGK